MHACVHLHRALKTDKMTVSRRLNLLRVANKNESTKSVRWVYGWIYGQKRNVPWTLIQYLLLRVWYRHLCILCLHVIGNMFVKSCIGYLVCRFSQLCRTQLPFCNRLSRHVWLRPRPSKATCNINASRLNTCCAVFSSIRCNHYTPCRWTVLQRRRWQTVFLSSGHVINGDVSTFEQC